MSRTVVALAQMRLVSSVGRADASGLGLRQGETQSSRRHRESAPSGWG